MGCVPSSGEGGREAPTRGDNLQRGSVSTVTDGDPEPRLGDLVVGEDHTRDCGDIDGVRAEALVDDNLRRRQLGRHRVPVATPIDQRLPGRDAFLPMTTTGNTVGGNGPRRSAANMSAAVVDPSRPSRRRPS